MFELVRRLGRVRLAGFTAAHTLARLAGCFLPFLRRGQQADGLLEHLGTLPLTAQSSLALVRVQQEMLVLGITPQSITLLTKSLANHAHDDDTSGLGSVEQTGSCAELPRLQAPLVNQQRRF